MIKQKEWVMMKSMFMQGMKIAAIAREIGVSRKTVERNLKKTKTPEYKRKVKKESKLDPYKESIEAWLCEHDLTAEKIYSRILPQGYKGKYGLVAEFVKGVKKLNRHKAVLRFETLPGEQAQVDWGYFGSFYDKEQKRVINLNCFFMILGYSRTLYIEFFEKADSLSFLRGHNNAFKYFGGYPKELLYDNLKSVVIKRKLKALDSEFNKKFMDFAGFYGFNPILCRPYKPNTKGKVENSVLFAKQNFFAGEKFSSLRELNERAGEWLLKVNNRIHSTTKEKPSLRLQRESLHAITALYDLSVVKYRNVFRDCHFSYGGNMYSVPFKYAGREVTVKEKDETINVIYRNEVIAVHVLLKHDKGKYVTNPEHLEGLKEIRCTHGIKRPKKNKPETQADTMVLLKNMKYKNIMQIESHDLNKYEELQ